jgi:hypothetical protein
MVCEAQPMILATSVMKVSNARLAFTGLETATVILASDDGTNPTDIIIQYESSMVFLKIKHTFLDINGCTIFDAALAIDNESIDQHRFSINLKSDYGCENLQCAWNASVREGYGFCGTMDASMDLFGYPEWRMAQ